jgi:hypothetical protein
MLVKSEDMMNNKKQLISGLMVILLIVLSGCSSTPTATPDLASTIAVNVAVAQTEAVILTSAAQTSAALTEQAIQSLTPTPTPTLQSTATSSYTATPNKILLTLSRDTYCRVGESSASQLVTLISKDQNPEVIAHNPTNDSYYVIDPNHSDSRCWVWGGYATLNAEAAVLPVYTSQPLPTATFTPKPVAKFSVSYVDMQNCGGDYYFRFLIKNTGAFTWQAIQINLYDGATKLSAVHNSTSFVDYTGCVAGTSQSDLTAGEPGYVAAYNAGQFAYDPTGHIITATISLCRTDASGGCDPQTISFTAK